MEMKHTNCPEPEGVLRGGFGQCPHFTGQEACPEGVGTGRLCWGVPVSRGGVGTCHCFPKEPFCPPSRQPSTGSHVQIRKVWAGILFLSHD